MSPIFNLQSLVSSSPIPSHALSFSPCQHQDRSSRSQSPSNPQSSSNTSSIDLSNSQPSNTHSLNPKSNAHTTATTWPYLTLVRSYRLYMLERGRRALASLASRTRGRKKKEIWAKNGRDGREREGKEEVRIGLLREGSWVRF